MIGIFIVLVVIVSAILAFLVLIQNPKGGGLAGNVGGVGNQLMGVKQTTDVLEKGTWIFAGIIGVLCLFSSFFIGKSPNKGGGGRQAAPSGQQAPAQQPAAPAN